MRRTCGLGVLAVAAALVAAACGGSDESGPVQDPTPADDRADVVEVVLTCDSDDPAAPCVFIPDEVTIQPGGTIRWVNGDGVFHTVTSSDEFDVRRPNGLFDEVVAELGAVFELTFDEPGEYPYYCQPHSDFMAGTVQVSQE